MPAQPLPDSGPSPALAHDAQGDAARLQTELRDRLPGFAQVDWVAATGSTNADLMARARAGAGPALPWLLGAWRQDSGRGRAGRPWANRSGETLMFSCAFEVTVPMDKLPSLSPMAGVVICEALRRLAGDQAHRLRMKWPNDIQVDGAKLVGILVETARNPATGLPVVVIGQGINLCDGQTLSRELGRAVADWSQIAPENDPAVLAVSVATALQQGLALFAAEGFAPFKTRHAALDALHDTEVNIVDDGQVIMTGIARGTDEQGRLLLETGQGLRSVVVGEVSVRAA